MLIVHHPVVGFWRYAAILCRCFGLTIPANAGLNEWTPLGSVSANLDFAIDRATDVAYVTAVTADSSSGVTRFRSRDSV